MMDKPKRETVWADYDIVSDGREMYDADEMDEWLKAEVLPVLRHAKQAIMQKHGITWYDINVLIAKLEPTDE